MLALIEATFAKVWLSQMIWTTFIHALVEYLPLFARTHDSPGKFIPV
jgi:hypothetical protein